MRACHAGGNHIRFDFGHEPAAFCNLITLSTNRCRGVVVGRFERSHCYPAPQSMPLDRTSSDVAPAPLPRHPTARAFFESVSAVADYVCFARMRRDAVGTYGRVFVR